MEGETDIRTEVAQLRALIVEANKTSQANNLILLQMRFWGRVAFLFKILVWVGVLILPFVIYHFLSPVFAPALHSFMNVFGNTGSSSASSTSLFGFPAPSQVFK